MTPGPAAPRQGEGNLGDTPDPGIGLPPPSPSPDGPAAPRKEKGTQGTRQTPGMGLPPPSPSPGANSTGDLKVVATICSVQVRLRHVEVVRGGDLDVAAAALVRLHAHAEHLHHRGVVRYVVCYLAVGALEEVAAEDLRRLYCPEAPAVQGSDDCPVIAALLD